MEWITVNIYKVNYCFTLLRRTHIDVFYSMMRWRKKSESLAWNRILYSFHSLVCYIRFFVEWKERNNMRVGGNGHDDDAKKFWFVETYGCTCIIHQFTFGAFVTHRWMKGMPRFPRNAKEGSSLRTPDINWTFG